MSSLENFQILTPLQKLPKNKRDLGQLIVAKGFKNLPKVQLIAQSGHTAPNPQLGQRGAAVTMLLLMFFNVEGFYH